MDDFNEPLLKIPPPPEPSGFVTNALDAIRSSGAAPSHIIITILLASVVAILATRQFSERPSSPLKDKNGRSVWMPAYWVPGIGHTVSLYVPARKRARGTILVCRVLLSPVQQPADVTQYQIQNLLKSKPEGVSSPIITNCSQCYATKGIRCFLNSSCLGIGTKGISLHSTAWASFMELTELQFFAIPKRVEKQYLEHWEDLIRPFTYLMKEPYLGKMLDNTTRNLEKLIPQMVSFMDGEIDQHPWERYANAEWISSKEMEVDLMSLVRDLMGHASVPSMFGHAFLENNPHVLHDIYDMDDGMMYFMAGLPWFTPWPSVVKAHFARRQAWDSVTKFQKALDAYVDGKHVDPSWGDMEDVSEFILKRHEIFRISVSNLRLEAGLSPEERSDISILWALVVNSTLLVYWHILYILATPDLLAEILEEIAPHVTITPGETIGSFSEAPKMHLSHEGLSKSCPLFKSTYLEALRLSDQPFSVRKLSNDVTLSTTSTDNNKTSYHLPANEHVTIPHNLHMQDPAYFPSPTTFNPTRFLSADKKSVDAGTIRPYGGGGSMCKGRVYAERECLAMAAGILMFWEFEPAAGMKGKWTIPQMKSTSAMAKPKVDTRVRIRRRVL
ncbi:cytochrome P450 protein [Rutstroemia sp. NJR-2017a WRK4]|nr:cytochrome P450 protein [Rutstroemia sp. NJR-2017a WRK4]